MRGLEQPSFSMEEGWVVVWPLCLVDELGKAQAPYGFIPAPPPPLHHPQPFLHRGGRERTALLPNRTEVALGQGGFR